MKPYLYILGKKLKISIYSTKCGFVIYRCFKTIFGIGYLHDQKSQGIFIFFRFLFLEINKF